jgi:hypothetical protein
VAQVRVRLQPLRPDGTSPHIIFATRADLAGEPGIEDLQLLPKFGTNTLGLGTNILEPPDPAQLARHRAPLSRKARKTVQVAGLRATATGRAARDRARRPE